MGERETRGPACRIAGRPARPNIWCTPDAGTSFFSPRLPLSNVKHDRTRGQVDAGGERFGANDEGHEFFEEEVLDDHLVPGQDAGVVYAHAAQQHLAQLGTDALG